MNIKMILIIITNWYFEIFPYYPNIQVNVGCVPKKVSMNYGKKLFY